MRIVSLLLIGCLSMLFAEVFSGASQAWFISGWGLLVTLPLYTAHVLFFLWIAMKMKKTSLLQLYLFGVLFGLYESWITKVLWAGYMNGSGPGMGTLFGVGLAEFPVLVFFWHPLMAFIVPILAFEIMTGKALSSHEAILRKSRKKTFIIALAAVLAGTFIAQGNVSNIVSVDISMLGTLLIVMVLHHFARHSDITSLEFGKRGFILLSGYMALLYTVTFFVLLPERIPTTATPYMTIAAAYLVPILLILKSKKTKDSMVTLRSHYSIMDFLAFFTVALVSANAASFSPGISLIVFAVTYYLLILIGTALFLLAVYRILKK